MASLLRSTALGRVQLSFVRKVIKVLLPVDGIIPWWNVEKT